jgi:uncharacterized membrane protein YtjA (UPF0391 family)
MEFHGRPGQSGPCLRNGIPALAVGQADLIERTITVFGFAITLLIIALIAAILGFGGIAGTLANIAIAIFVIALVIGLVLLFFGWKAAKSVVD